MKKHTAKRGVLHRAISVFLFDHDARLLLQQRHPQKPLWGGYWSNSCCTHPYPNEPAHESARRRVREELGINAQLSFRFKLQYQASFTKDLAENELVSVYTGTVSADPLVDPEEIAAWRWISAADLQSEFANRPDQFTPWLKLEWARLAELSLV